MYIEGIRAEAVVSEAVVGEAVVGEAVVGWNVHTHTLFAAETSEY